MDEYIPRQSHAASRRTKRADYRQELCRLMCLFLIAALLLVTAVNFITPERAFSENENRILASRPAFSAESVMDGSFMDDAESWQADQFFARDKWIALKLKTDTFLGKKESNGIYLGADNYLIAAPESPNETAVQRNLAAIAAFAQAYNTLNIQMMIVPNAASVMELWLPANAPVRDQQADLAALRAQLPPSMGFIDVTNALRSHASEGVFYRTDHHWTSLGAYYAFQSAASALGITELKSYVPHVVSTTFEGTLASRSGSHKVTDVIEVYEPVDPGSEFVVNYDATLEKSRSLFVSECLNEKDQYTVFFGGNHPRITIRTTANNGRVLLIFKDSYANCFVQFLTPYYETILLIDPRYYYDDAGALMADEGVTDVLFPYNLDTWLSDTSLADTLTSAAE